VADWADRRVTVLGLGKSGVSAARYLAQRGARVFVSEGSVLDGEKRQQADELAALGVRVESGGHSDEALAFGELVITSPGVPPHSDVMARARRLGKEVICDVELAYRETRVPIIAITGTNGKSTTCALISHILSKTGRVAPACGNFGVPILSQLDKKPDFLVVEVSSYQLAYCSAFAPMIAVWLNLTPDHLDWHGDLERYIEAKRKLFEHQRYDQYAVLNMDDPVVAETDTRSEVFPFSVNSELPDCVQGAFMKDGFLCYRIHGRTRVVCAPEELKIRGRHNLENALAAMAVAAILEVEPVEIELYLKDFEALEHRLEYVATVGGVPYYNDSKATNPTSAIKALEAFPDEKVVLIAGGRDKGTALDEFVECVKRRASAVILMGEASERFARELKAGGFGAFYPVDGMAAAVELGGQLKQGPVLLSPACASFDMFRDYEDRGRVFKDLVRARLEKLAPSV
jgi:UDP-N-acetylmuramoylalanine--D-glutamate ligase